MAPHGRRLALACGLLLLAGCFDPPVKESVRLRFFPNGAVAVTDTVELDLLKEGENNPALERRMSDLRRELLDGLDPWARRFASAEPVAERLSWEKRFGVLASARRSVLIAEPEALRDLFGDTSVSVSYSIAEDGTAELTLAPGVPAQATRRQRKDMERAIEEWSGHVAEYLAATGDLYAWLEDNPGRVRPCFRELFSELVVVEEAEEMEEELSAEEMKRVKRVGDAMEKVLDVLLIPKGQDRSLDELSHLVYDPFPAPLSILLPGEALEVEGFQESDEEEKVWTVDSPGLWTALRSLEEQWIAPDPVMIYVAHRKDGELDLDKLVEMPRRFARPLPNSLEVQRAIEEKLKPASPVYRAVWQALPPAEAEDAEFSWEDN
ncbi:MAG TPA: hypothetical protein VF414_12340 [Thermoanaerobaculia bacterium]